MIEPISAAIEPHIKRPAPTREQVREILRSLDIEEKTFTSLTHAPLACWYGLTDPGKIMEFAAKLVTSSAGSPSPAVPSPVSVPSPKR